MTVNLFKVFKAPTGYTRCIDCMINMEFDLVLHNEEKNELTYVELQCMRVYANYNDKWEW